MLLKQVILFSVLFGSDFVFGLSKIVPNIGDANNNEDLFESYMKKIIIHHLNKSILNIMWNRIVPIESSLEKKGMLASGMWGKRSEDSSARMFVLKRPRPLRMGKRSTIL